MWRYLAIRNDFNLPCIYIYILWEQSGINPTRHIEKEYIAMGAIIIEHDSLTVGMLIVTGVGTAMLSCSKILLTST